MNEKKIMLTRIANLATMKMLKSIYFFIHAISIYLVRVELSLVKFEKNLNISFYYY
jgi:hypothetical protein